MLIDWENTDVSITSFGKHRWKKGVKNDGSWTGYVTDQHIWLPYCGQGQVTIHDGKAAFQRGRLFWFKPGFCYYATQTPHRPIGMYVVHFNIINHNFAAEGASLRIPPDVIENIDSDYLEMLFEKMIAIGTYIIRQSGYIISENEYRREKTLTLLKLILMKIEEVLPPHLNEQPQEVTPDDVMASVIYKMQHDPTYRPNVKDIAAQVEMSPSAFCHLFKRRYITPLNQLSILWRIGHATRLLKETHLSVKEIAQYLGYHSIKLFGRQFKKRTGITPLQYRRQTRKSSAS